MMSYVEIALNAYKSYAAYLWHEISSPSWHSYFYWLIGISIFAFTLELLFPWRKQQGKFREDFWLDAFYMFFNFFIFSLIAYNALSEVVVTLFSDFLGLFGIQNLVAIEISSWPLWSKLVVLFILRDFIQWNVHRMLHYFPTLWEFHKVHHSVQQMGFAAHLRYHFMETIIYRTVEYIPLAMIGFGLTDFFIVHIFALAIGHLNHSNIYLPLGPLQYIFNSPQMHIWHHAEHLPANSKGVNYGLTLSIWDYIFNTVYMPKSGRDEKLGFENVDQFAKGFVQQSLSPFKNILKKKGASSD
ncbi:MAG: sterol desaturase family protein [Saprospiraceae bacterium]|nr:sterol desaturase family protein [Saprospiraceae bacterium]